MWCGGVWCRWEEDIWWKDHMGRGGEHDRLYKKLSFWSDDVEADLSVGRALYSTQQLIFPLDFSQSHFLCIFTFFYVTNLIPFSNIIEFSCDLFKMNIDFPVYFFLYNFLFPFRHSDIREKGVVYRCEESPCCRLRLKLSEPKKARKCLALTPQCLFSCRQIIFPRGKHWMLENCFRGRP